MQRSRTIDFSAKIDALVRRHAECEEKLQTFVKRTYLTPQEQNEVRRLKRQKLLVKDSISRIQGSA